MKEVFTGDLAGAYELSFDEIDLVSGGTPEQAYAISGLYLNGGASVATVSAAAGFVPGVIAGGLAMGVGAGFQFGAAMGFWQ
jgi:hypothetical protein